MGELLLPIRPLIIAVAAVAAAAAAAAGSVAKEDKWETTVEGWSWLERGKEGGRSGNGEGAAVLPAISRHEGTEGGREGRSPPPALAPPPSLPASSWRK